MNDLPTELIFEIAAFALPEDQKSLSLVSQRIRKQALHFIFNHLQYSGLITPKLRNIHQARKDVKEAVRTLYLHMTTSNVLCDLDNDDDIIFQFLETLPNLGSLRYNDERLFSSPTDLLRLNAAVHHNPLRQFCLIFQQSMKVEGQPLIGPSGLQKLSVIWESSAFAQLDGFIRPSLTTLVELQISSSSGGLADFDLRLLKPAGNTLRVFFFAPRRVAERIFHDIPDVLPNLTRLTIVSKGPPSSALWADTLIDGLCKLNNLEDLVLSSDLEVQTADIMRADQDFAWYVRCYKRRLKASQKVASLCKKLRQCTWIQVGIDYRGSYMLHPFIVEERRSTFSTETTRVVRGVKQFWMGQDQHDWITGGVVKCKLEDLPGDIVP